MKAKFNKTITNMEGDKVTHLLIDGQIAGFVCDYGNGVYACDGHPFPLAEKTFDELDSAKSWLVDTVSSRLETTLNLGTKERQS